MDQHDPATGPGYEKTDAVAWATVRAGLYILGIMFLTAAILVPVYRFLLRREAGAQRQPATVLKPPQAPAEPVFPRLVTSEPAVLAGLRAQEEELLASWAWVEKDRGIARMPVEEAIKIVARRGLPRFPAATPAPSAAPTAAPDAPPAPTPAGSGGAR